VKQEKQSFHIFDLKFIRKDNINTLQLLETIH
jgi:hypothetical protein